MHNPKTKNIDEYISLQSEDSVEGLEKLRQIIRSVAPEATELISYHMPAFKYQGMLVGFAAWKNHYDFYPWNSSTVNEFKEDLKGYDTTKGAIQFPKDKPLPVTLIKKIVKARMKQNIEKEQNKKATKK
ncbi:MAG: hypothetical protein JWQ30_108 [Sediminibacterium sp.]|nr:hypothetical protein [Sediminibacterium sp.]